MDYVREHVKKYWGVVYRRTLGVAFITFAVAIAMGLTFTILTRALAITGLTTYLVFWAIIAIIAISVLLANFYGAHVSSVNFMSEEEHRTHSKHMARWMIAIVAGVSAFFAPLPFTPIDLEPIVLLFSIGGVFLVLYASITLIFKHKYGELAIGGAAYWVVFYVGLATLSSSQFNFLTRTNFSVYFAAMCITIITGFTGLALLYDSAKESAQEFIRSIERIDRDERKLKGRGAAGRKRR